MASPSSRTKDNFEAFRMLESDRAAAVVMVDILLYSLVANSAAPADYVVLDDALSVEPYGILLRRDDPAFKKVADDAFAAIFHNGDINKVELRIGNDCLTEPRITMTKVSSFTVSRGPSTAERMVLRAACADDRDVEAVSVALNRGRSHVLGFKRVMGSDIIALRRSNSAHLHRPWRAICDKTANRSVDRRGVPTPIGTLSY